MVAGCRTSGVLTASALVNSGKCKLVSIHAYNSHAGQPSTITVYDNTAASGKQVAEIILPPHLSSIMDDTSGGDQDATQNTTVQLEADYHGVLCRNGLYVDVTNGTPRLTVEFS